MATPIAPFVLVPLAVLALYRRFRRNVGRQLLRPKTVAARIAILSLMALALATLAWLAPQQLGLAVAAGLAGGAAFALVGLKLTRFEAEAERRYYTPNPYIGIALSALLLARLAYRFMVLFPAAQAGPAVPPAFGSPLTLSLVAALIGYYLSYSAGILLRSRAPA